MQFLLCDMTKIAEEGFDGFGLFSEEQDEDDDEDSGASSSIDQYISVTTADPVILPALAEADKASCIQSTVDDGNSATSDKG